jgi:hypothetical protein
VRLRAADGAAGTPLAQPEGYAAREQREQGKREVKMQVAAFRREVNRETSDELEREEFVRSMASLREDVCSMSTDIRQVLSENMALRQEVGRLKARRESGQSTSELRRLKRQLDRLIEAHESASAPGGGRGRRHTERPSGWEDPPKGGSWMNKMMMFMMLSELA